MRSFAAFLTLVLPLSLQACASHGTAETIHSDADKPVWIDVRSEEEYQAGHVEPAINIPYEEIADRISALQLAPGQTIFLYCRSGRRSGIALETLSSLGYTRLTNVGGLADAQLLLAPSPK